MMTIVFDDNNLHKKLAPLTLTRPVSELRFGINTISQSWIHYFGRCTVSYQTQEYLNSKFTAATDVNAFYIAGNIKPTAELAKQVAELKSGEKLMVNNRWIASNGKNAANEIHKNQDDLLFIENLWDIFQKNDAAIKLDFERIKEHRTSAVLSNSNQIAGIQNIFIEEGAKVEFSILNATEGPIYIAAHAEIMEGSMIRGPFALGEHSTVKMGAKIYGATTIGPHCKVGGEISNSVFQAYSNKGHDGFLGNSVIGEWCNLGADTNSSNLMNTYGKLKIYSFQTEKSEQTDITFCGVLMGDHTKTGINTMLNTATVIGVSANIFGAGFPAKYIPSFTWGAAESCEKFKQEKAFEVATNMMLRRGIEFTEAEQKIMQHLFQMAQ